jgi:hypothetical protein
MKYKFLFILLVTSLVNIPLFSQSFGFGCLGLVGGFAGYSYQRYEPTGLNEYISVFNDIRRDSLSSPMPGFGNARGIRVGINLFRADFQGFILTTKGFYQSLLEKHDTEVLSISGTSNYNYELKMNYWGVGVDLGTSITRALSWKVIDASILFNNVTFSDNQNFPGGYSQLKEYKNDSNLGYTIGTGFILSLVEGYISLEGLAGYTQLTVKSMRLEDGTEFPVNELSSEPAASFIDNGGFTAVIQLNIGFPL